MLTNIFIFIVALFLVIKGATLATKYAARLANNFHVSEYIIGFIIISIISILPETFISINAAINGIPEFGLATLFGSNTADLTLVFVILILYAGRSLKVESKILKNQVLFPFILLVPLVLGMDGYYSRIEGIVLVIVGISFYYIALRNDRCSVPIGSHRDKLKNSLWLLFSMAILLLGSHFTVIGATNLANNLGISSIIIGMLVVGLGTTMPELFFSLKSIEKNDDSLALGDILGTVLSDAIIVVGILALIDPFSFSTKIIYITGIFMVVAAFLLFQFMRTGKRLSKKEACILLLYWIAFAIVSFMTGVQ